MKATDLLAMVSLSVVLSACGGIQAGGNVQSGVEALLAGNNQTALTYFQAAAQQDVHGAARDLAEVARPGCRLDHVPQRQ